MSGFPVSLDDGWVDAGLAREFPDLRLATLGVPCAPGKGKASRGVQQRLVLASDRMNGAKALKLRRDPIPSAYRIFYRLTGLDPDATRTPIEEAALQRLFDGGFGSRGLVEDALLLGLIETGVPVYALDEETLAGPLGIRFSAEGERLEEGEYASDIVPGRMVVADPERPVAELFGPVAAPFAVGRRTRKVRLMAVGVAGVPAIHVEEALWACAEALQAG